LSVEKQVEILNNQKNLTKAVPSSEIYIELLKAKLLIDNDRIEEGSKLINEIEEKLKEFRSYPNIIFARLNEVKLIYFWKKEDYSLFNSVIFKYLAYADTERLHIKEKIELARKTILSLLLCDSTLNFTGITTNEFFECLNGTPHSHLLELV